MISEPGSRGSSTHFLGQASPAALRAGVTGRIQSPRDAGQGTTAAQHEHTSRRYAAGRCHFVCLCMGRGGSAAHPRTNRLRTQHVAVRPCEALVGYSTIACPPMRGSGGCPEGAATLRYHVGRPLWPSLLLSQGGLRPFSWTSQPRCSPSRGHGAKTVAPRRRARGTVDSELSQLRSRTATNSSACTSASENGVRRLCDGLLPLKAEIQSNPEQPETSQSSRIPTPMVQVGVRGESQRLLRHSATVFAP